MNIKAYDFYDDRNESLHAMVVGWGDKARLAFTSDGAPELNRKELIKFRDYLTLHIEDPLKWKAEVEP